MLAVVYLDLDEFKPVNDTFGHDKGDMLLVDVSQRLKKHLRSDDTVAQVGGDEFILLLSEINNQDECQLALQRILDGLSTTFALEEHSVTISASIGVTLYPQDKTDPETLLRHADQAMYVAKQYGRNRYHFFDPIHDKQVQSDIAALAEIQSSLEKEEFVLFYQPIIELSERKVIGVEALIRWQHQEKGILSPMEFLPIVEGSHLEVQLGNWVLSAAFRQLEEWQKANLNLVVSINISARHLQQKSFVEYLSQLLQDYPLVPAKLITLEIVETAALNDMQQVSEIIKNCHHLGVKFALDDFGTGYSSLTYFKRLPIDKLKIDQSFIRDMLVDKEDYAIVKATVSLAQAFQRTVVAEGIETEEHLKALMEIGCEFGQGYGIARPMSAELIEEWIHTWQC